MPVLHGCEGSLLLEDAVKSLVGIKAAEGNGFGYRLLVAGVSLLGKNALRLLDTETVDVCREIDAVSMVDSGRDITAVAANGISEVLDCECGIGE